MQYKKQDLTNKQIPRYSNIELLRIIAMIFIVAHHFSIHGGFVFSTNTITINRLWVQFIQIGGKIGVDVFVLISGYFLISAKSLKTNKVIKFWLQLFTYSALIFILFIALGIEPFGIKELISHCFPVTFSQWWFASTYFVLYLTSPYINRLLNTFDKRGYQRFLILLTIFWCIIPTFTAQTFQSNELLWFVYLYSLAGFIRLYSPKFNIKGTTYILLAIMITILTFLSAVGFDILGIKVQFLGNHATFFYNMQSLPIALISVLLLIGFSKINIGYKRVINLISSATFGVYLIHDNAYVRTFLWKTVFANATYSESKILIPYSVLVIAIVFIVCTIIELIRIYVLEQHYIRSINSFANVIDNCKEKLLSLSIFNKF